MEIATVPAHYVNALLHSAERHGLDRGRILLETGIDPAVLEGERARLPSGTFSTLSTYLIGKMQDENCGLMRLATKPGSFVMMCQAAISSPTLREFLRRCARFNGLVNDSVTITLSDDGERGVYAIAAEADAVDEDQFIVMILLGITHRLASWAVGHNIALEAVNIGRPRPAYAHEYNFLFMAPIYFGQPDNRLLFPSSFLDMPVTRTVQELDQFLCRPSISLMASPDLDNSLVSRIRALIKADVGGAFPEFERVADSLHMTTATLRRKLRAEGSSYQQLKDDIRRDTAIYHLGRNTLSMEQVAQSVGFSEPASFFRAFKRWTGLTPRAYVS